VNGHDERTSSAQAPTQVLVSGIHGHSAIVRQSERSATSFRGPGIPQLSYLGEHAACSCLAVVLIKGKLLPPPSEALTRRSW